MKFTLTITDATIDELVAILISPTTPATLRNSVAAAVGVAANSDDDDGSDIVADAGSVDSTGLPWDERIHSTPASLTKKGVWRAKRNLTDKAFVANVEAELRARAPQTQQQPAPVPQYQPPVPQMQPVNIDPNFQPPQSVVIPPQQMQPAPVPQYQPPVPQQQPAPQMQQPVPQQMQQPVTAPAPGSVDFMGFMQHVMTISQSGKADANYFADLANRVGAAFQTQLPQGITNFQQDQRMVDYAIQIMVQEGRWA